MTKKQKLVVESYVKKFLELREDTDRERIHIHADNLLLEVLHELGFGEVSEAYGEVSEIGFWYA